MIWKSIIEKIKKRNYANIRNKYMSDEDRKRKKEHTKNHYYKKNLKHRLINLVEELGNVSLNK